MSAPAKQTSRWGSFLSQAVAGVEARLDTILADEDPLRAKETKPPATSQAPTTSQAAPSAKSSPGPSRAASSTRANDRLQEKLARALAAKSAGAKQELSSTRPSASGQSSPRRSIDTSARPSIEIQHEPTLATSNSPVTSGLSSTTDNAKPVVNEPTDESTARDHDNCVTLQQVDAGGVSDNVDFSTEQQLERKPAPTDRKAHDVDGCNPALVVEVTSDEQPMKEAEQVVQNILLQHQEETHNYIERIDALESKLQFLAREANESARKAVLSAPADSVEKKLAEKDQQIAQLMEEGKTLASTEQKHRAIMKKLRAKIAEHEKELTILRTDKEKINQELESLRQRARQVDELERLHTDLQRKWDQTQQEVNTLQSEGPAKDTTIAELRTQLHRAKEQVEATNAKLDDEAREQDVRRIAELEETVAALNIEKKLVSDRARLQASELREKAERAHERAKAMELECKAEIQAMDGKLEVMRVRAEEASSGAVGDSQAKLLRQIETLQTQYSIASDNWQGIEATLLARIASLERERDEAAQREADMKRKARDAAMRAKRSEEELEDTRSKIPAVQDLTPYHNQIEGLQKRAESAEVALADLKAEFNKQRQMLKERHEDKLSTPPPQPSIVERRGWLEDLHSGPFQIDTPRTESRPVSPLLSLPQRSFSTDLLGVQALPNKLRRESGPPSNSDAGMARNGTLSRRASTVPIHPSSTTGATMPFSAPTDTERLAMPSLTHSSHRDREEALEGVETPSTPHQVLQDMMSVSTVAAGPSVQLVERMSAAIRRLESEKVAAREELTRISKQRDEARVEIVALMREVEAGKSALQKTTELEASVKDMQERYETTLEMLGEKTELVEELRADVEDVKAMYRELVERTVQ